MRDAIQEVHRGLIEAWGAPVRKPLGAAVSGGADSTFLACSLASLRERALGPSEIVLLHVHHGLRPGADGDERFVRELGERLRLPVVALRGDVEGHRRRHRLSLETAAREVRYALLEGAARREGLAALATAHTRDDQAETVLFRILRGTGVRGLAGIAPARPILPGSSVRLLRPLLLLSNATIRRWLKEHGVPWREDPSNQDLRFRRNLVRNRLLPLLESEANPRVRDALCRLARDARVATDLLSGIVRDLLPAVLERHDDEVSLERTVLLAQPEAVRLRLVEEAFSEASGGISLSLAEKSAILRLARKGVSNSRLHVAGPAEVVYRYGRLIFRRRMPPREARRPEPTLVTGEGVFACGPVSIHITWTAPPGGTLGSSPDLEYVDGDRLSFPLVLRPWRPGDRLRPLGMQGTRKVKDILADLKVPREARAEALVLESGGEIVWLVGYRLHDGFRVREETRRCVRIELTRGGAIEEG